MPLTRTTQETNIGGGLRRAQEDAAARGTGGLRRTLGKSKQTSVDLDTTEGLVRLAQSKGLGEEIKGITDDKDKNLSVLQRLVYGLSSFNPADALYKQLEGTDSFLSAYPKDVVQGIASALTGTDYGEQTKKKFFSDVAEQMGVQNKYARFGLGLVGDIFLDPSTYVGGTLLKYGVKGVSKVASAGGKAALKVLPESVAAPALESVTKAGEAITAGKQAFGSMFVYGYGAAKETARGLLKFKNETTNVMRNLAISNAKRYGNDILTDDQWEEFLGKLFEGKNAEFDLYDKVTDDAIEMFNKRFPQARLGLKDRKQWEQTIEKSNPEEWASASKETRDLMVRSAIRTSVTNRISSTVSRLSNSIGRIQTIRDQLARPFIADDLIGIKNSVNELKKELDELSPKTVVKEGEKKPFMATDAEHDIALAASLDSEKQRLKKIMLALETKIGKIEAGVIEPAEKKVKELIASGTKYNADDIVKMAMRELDPDRVIKDKIVELNTTVNELTNEMFVRQNLLERVLEGKTLAKDLIKKAFETGDFSNIPMDIAAALRPVSDDPAVQKALTERISRNAELAKQAGIENPYAVYAPSIRAKDVTQKKRLMDFFNGTSRLQIGSEGYKKEYRKLLKDEELLKDRTLFLRVEDQIATNKMTREFYGQIMQNIGKPLTAFKNEADAMANGYRLLKEKGIHGKEIGYIPEGDWKFLNGQIGDTYGAIDAIAKATGFDVLNSAFKRFVTGPFPSFHVRNWTSGKLQNYEAVGWQALTPTALATGARLAHKISKGAFQKTEDFFDLASNIGNKVKSFGNESITIRGKEWKLDDLGRAIQERFGHSSFYQNDYNNLLRDADLLTDAGAFSKQALKSWGKNFTNIRPDKNPVAGLFGEDMPIFKSAKTIGTFIELSQKSEAVVGALMKGHTLDEALDLAERAGFDYSKLTPFEGHIMRRIIPFYSFMRKNAELQLKTLGEHPERINHIIRSIENVQNLWETKLTEEEKKNLPTYLREYLSVPVGRGKNGLPEFVRSFGTPIEAFTNLVKTSADGKSGWERTFLSTLSNVTPYIKAPIEIAIGKDSFRQRDLKDVYTANEYQIAPDWLKEFLHFKEIQKKTSEGKPYTQYVADPKRLLVMRSLFTSRGFTYLNNVFNGNVPGFLRVMESVSGISSDEVNTEFYASLTERQQKEAIGAILRRYGIVGEFSKLFIPKEK